MIYHAFDADLAKAKASKDTNEYHSLLNQQGFEVAEYLQKLRSIRSRRLLMEAERLYIHIPDLKWEDGAYGEHYLDAASQSKLYYAVKEQKDKIREYRLKLATPITGIIGALIGLIAIWKK